MIIKFCVFIVGLAMLLIPSIGAAATDVSCNVLDWQNCSIPLNPVIDFVTKLVQHMDKMTGEVVSDSIGTFGDKVNLVFGDKQG